MIFKKKVLDDNGIEYQVIGDIKSYTIKDLHDDINTLIREESPAYFSFDFSDVEYIDSQGVTLIVITGKYNYKQGLKLPIINASTNIKRIFDLAEIKFIDLVNRDPEN